MKILIIVSEMITLTGSPMYNYTLAIELKRQGHDVDIFSIFSNNVTRRNLSEIGVNVLSKIDYDVNYDLTLVSQKKYEKAVSKIKSDITINIVHSEYDEELPIINSSIDNYIAIRPSIKDKIVKKNGLSSDKVEVIYNGVDLSRFNKINRKKHKGDFIKVVLPCSICKLRHPFIEYYTKQASKDFQVHIYGEKYHTDFYKNEWVFIHDATFDIENHIYDADYIAGILLGRINLEARAMGIPSYIHDPDKPTNFYLYDIEDHEFNDRHNIENVVKSIIDLYEKIKTPNDVKTDTNYKLPTAINLDLPSYEVNKAMKKYFTNIYLSTSNRLNACSTGSNLEQTKTLINQLPILFKQYNIQSILDIPCGDFYWMSNVDLTGIDYTGADIVDGIIEKLIKQYPDKKFLVMDITKSKLPVADLIFCRDCFVQLPYDDIKIAIHNIKRSHAKYLLTTSFINHNNTDRSMGNWRPIDLCKEPFNFPKPIQIINEGCTENNGIYKDKTMCLWKISEI